MAISSTTLRYRLSFGSVGISGMGTPPRLSATLTPPPWRSISVLTIDTPAIISSTAPLTTTDSAISCWGVVVRCCGSRLLAMNRRNSPSQ